MKTLRLFGLAIFAVMLSFNLTSCSSDDDDEEGGGGSSSSKGGVVVSSLPEEGWSGDMQNGVATYSPEGQYVDEEDGIKGGCYAFEFVNGVCKNSAYNIVCSSEYYAKAYAEMLNSGAWADFDDEYDDYELPAHRVKGMLDAAPLLARSLLQQPMTKAGGSTLTFNVMRKGSVLYISLDNFKGCSSDDVEYAIDVWNGITIPNRFVFGEWDADKGEYFCSNLYGLDMDYLVNVSFDANRYVKSYVTTITMPSEAWAEVMYEVYLEAAEDMMAQFGEYPEIDINGRTVKINAIILDDVEEEMIVNYLKIIDFVNNRPLLAGMFY